MTYVISCRIDYYKNIIINGRSPAYLPQGVAGFPPTPDTQKLLLIVRRMNQLLAAHCTALTVTVTVDAKRQASADSSTSQHLLD
jgi:hypothetical protein